MDSHVDSNMISSGKSQTPQHIDEDEKDRLMHSSRGKELTISGYFGDLQKRKPLLKQLMIRFFFLVIAITAMSGQLQSTANRLMGPVWEYNETYLERTLKNLGGSLFVLSVPKGVLEMAESIEVEPSFAASKLGSIKAGDILEPYIHIIDDIWDFLVLSTYLVIGQLAAIQLIQLVSIKFFLGFGALACVVQYKKNTFFGKLGLTLIALFLLTYVYYPMTLNLAAKTYESHQIETSTELSENLGILKEQASDIELSVAHIKENIKLIPQVLGQGIKTAWDAALGLVVGLILMFVLLPLLTLGSMYLIAKRVLLYLDMPNISDKLEQNTQRVVSKIGSHTRLKLSNS
jgi:hypothetical protein